MCKARHILSLIIPGLIIFLGLFTVLDISPALAQRSVNAIADNPANLCSRACRQYLSGNSEESLALYQKAIVKAESEYGKNARVTGSLYYEMGVRALDSSKFNLAERCFKKAAEINPHGEAAQLMLVQLLRFRDRDAEASAHAQQVLKKRWDSKEARRDLMLCLQDKDPAAAARQAFIINCLQNDALNKIPGFERQANLEKSVDQIRTDRNATSQLSSKGNNTTGTSKVSGPSASKEKNARKEVKDVITKKKQITAQIKGKRPKAKTFSQGKAKSPALVPPPPPIQLNLPNTAGTQKGLKASAARMKLENVAGTAKKNSKKEKTKQAKSIENAEGAQSKESPKTIEKPQRSASDADPDFLLDWAAIKKKPAKK